MLECATCVFALVARDQEHTFACLTSTTYDGLPELPERPQNRSEFASGSAETFATHSRPVVKRTKRTPDSIEYLAMAVP